MTDISKTVFTFTVLHPGDEQPLSLEDAMYQSMYGNAVGWETDRETIVVPAVDVPAELIALGNDGAFFDEDDE